MQTKITALNRINCLFFVIEEARLLLARDWIREYKSCEFYETKRNVTRKLHRSIQRQAYT